MLGKLLKIIVFALVLSISALAVSAFSVTILPSNPTTNNDLTCYVNGVLCSHEIGCNSHWFINNREVLVNPILSSSYTNGGDIIKCEAYSTNSPTYYGEASVTISNRPFPVNHPPVISNIPDINFNEDTVYNFNLNPYASDIDGDAITWTYSGNTNIRINIANGIATFSAPLNWNGQENIVFTASDNYGGSDSEDVLVTVNPVNDPIILNSILEIDMYENSVYNLDLNDYIIDVDNDLNGIVVTGNTNINVNVDFTQRIITLTPRTNWNGAEILTIRVEDLMTSDSQSVFVRVIDDVDSPPVINSFTPNQASVNIDEGNDLLFSINASDPEGSALTYQWRLDTNVVGTGTNYLHHAIDGPDDGHILQVFVSDGVNTASHSWNIDEINVAPSVSANGPYVCSLGNNLVLRGSASDPGQDMITFEWELSNGVGGFDQELPINCGNNEGIVTINLRATDDDGGFNVDTTSLTISSTPQNNQPYFDPHLNDQHAIIGQVFTYDINAYDADQGDVLTYSDNAAQFNINPNTGVISFTPTTREVIPATITVCDNKGMPNSCNSESFDIFVSLTGNENPVVQITSPSNGANFNFGNSITFNGNGNDFEDGTLTGNSLVWTSSLNGLIGTGNSFSTNSLSVGTHVITLTGTDSDGATGTAIISIIVSGASSQCSDGIDNDNDGLIDLFDPGCTNLLDNDETNPSTLPECADGIDNDGDGRIDYPNDLGCTAAGDTSEGQNPVAVAGNDVNTYVNNIVRFNGSSSYDNDGTIVTYSWNFGDGNTGTGANVQHSYSSAGTYTARLTVTDNEGLTGTDTLIVSVAQGGSSGLNLGYTLSGMDNHEFKIKTLKLISEVKAGEDVRLLVELEDTGSYDEKVNFELKNEALLFVKDFGEYEVEEGKTKIITLIFKLPKEASGVYNFELEAYNDNYRDSKTIELDSSTEEGIVSLLTGGAAGYNVEIEKDYSTWMWIFLILVVLILIGFGIWKIYKND